MAARVIYSRGFPYGAPLVMLRGGATKLAGIREFLKRKGFRWSGASFAWENYMYKDELREILLELRDRFECEVIPKEGIDPNYIVELDDGKGN